MLSRPSSPQIKGEPPGAKKVKAFGQETLKKTRCSENQYPGITVALQNELSKCLEQVVLTKGDRLVGLMVRRPPRERKVPGSNPACGGIFSGSSHTNDLKIGTPVATMPGAWRYRVSTGTGRPGVSILWLGEVERLICNVLSQCGST